MKKIISILLTVTSTLYFLTIPMSAAAAGIYASGGGNVTVGQTFTVTVDAGGATFNAIEGRISVSGPVSIVSFVAGGATWIAIPANGTHFKGMLVPAVGSLRVATIRLKATGVGSGAVTVSSVRMANDGAEVGTGAGSTSFSVTRAPAPPGAIKVTSSSHPNPAESYEATKIDLSWTKAAGVTAFSYLLDQNAKTTPAAKSTSTNTSASYENQPVGTHYFHIRAQNADGWGSTTHFQINIKEPDAKIDENLSKPRSIKIEKMDNFVNNIEDGTVSGIKISGITEPEYLTKIILTPAPALPEGKKLEVEADENGDFILEMDYFIPAGHYKLTVQGEKEKVLTPVSDEIIFEISQAKGGSINILTEDDINPPKSVAETVKASGNYNLILTIAGSALALGLLTLLIILIRKRKRNRI
jgi:hypothetical protein